MRIKNNSIYGTIAALVAWLFIIGIGWTMLSRYENTPGQAEAAPQRWPLTSQMPRIPHFSTLLMFVHPHCPCTRASLEELALIETHCQHKAKTQVIFVRPENVSKDWINTDLWRSAMAIPGVDVLVDDNGKEADIFHAAVSGQVMLYDAQGNLVFSGGITSSRGHSGDNDGRDAIEAFLNKGTVPVKGTSFFGCLLLNRESNKAQGGK